MTRPDDEQVSNTIEKAYAILKFEPGGRPDWVAGDQLYSPRAGLALRVFPDDAAVSVMSWEDYKDAQMADRLEEHGYSETPGERVIHIVGDIAVVHQRFTMNFRHRPRVEAVDVFGLVRMNDTWQIVSVLSDMAPSPDPTST